MRDPESDSDIELMQLDCGGAATRETPSGNNYLAWRVDRVAKELAWKASKV